MIKIIKKSAAPPDAPTPPVVTPAAPPAPKPVLGGLRIPMKKPPAPKPLSKEYPPETDEQRLARWKNFPGPNEKLKQCTHCEQWYIRPCDEKKAQVCANGIHFREKTAA